MIGLIDDLDGTTRGVRTVKFSLDRTTYTIDLAEHNLARLQEVLAPFIAAARRPARPSRRPNRALNRAVRAWATEQDIELQTLGRIPNSVVQQYYDAHP